MVPTFNDADGTNTCVKGRSTAAPPTALLIQRPRECQGRPTQHDSAAASEECSGQGKAQAQSGGESLSSNSSCEL